MQAYTFAIYAADRRTREHCLSSGMCLAYDDQQAEDIAFDKAFSLFPDQKFCMQEIYVRKISQQSLLNVADMVARTMDTSERHTTDQRRTSSQRQLPQRQQQSTVDRRR